MTDQAICEGNYSESSAEHTTGGGGQPVSGVRLHLVRIILGNLWEGPR